MFLKISKKGHYSVSSVTVSEAVVILLIQTVVLRKTNTEISSFVMYIARNLKNFEKITVKVSSPFWDKQLNITRGGMLQILQ